MYGLDPRIIQSKEIQLMKIEETNHKYSLNNSDLKVNILKQRKSSGSQSSFTVNKSMNPNIN